MGAELETAAQAFWNVTAIEVASDAAGIRVDAVEAADAPVQVLVVDRAGKPQAQLLDAVQEDGDGGVLRVRVRTVRGRRLVRRPLDVRLLVRAPRHVAVRVDAEAGNVTLDGRDAAVTIRTKAGAIRVTDVHADVELRSDAGAVLLSGTRGSVVASTSAGAIRLEDHHGEQIELRSDAGAIKGSDLEVGHVTTRTEAGAVKLAFATPPVSVDARCTLGAVHLELPREAYQLDLRSGGMSRQRVEGIEHVPGAERRVTVSTELGLIRLTAAAVPAPS